jgi:hypothetical protein
MYVIKADGQEEEFQPDKIIKTCLRADASIETAREIAEEISKNLQEGTTTHEIYEMILSGLRKRRDKSSLLFTLRESISRLDSTCFELYAKRILEAHGYQCKWNAIIRGKSVEHQVDIIATGSKMFLVECKHHVNYHRFCSLGNLLQVQARLEDIKDGFRDGKNKYGFDYAWMLTNTKFSEHAKMYAEAKDIRLTGWRYKGEDALEDLIQSKKIFPVTILRCSAEIKRYMLNNEIITLQDLIDANRIKPKDIEKSKLEGLIRQAEKLLS